MKTQEVNFTMNYANFMHLLSLTIILSLIAPVIVKAQANKANFSGKWELNEAKSNLGDSGRRRFGGGNFTATQEANLLTVERTFTTQDGEKRTVTSKYTLDGKESVNTMGRGERKSTANWSADGKSLTIVTKSSYNGNERTSTEVWTLTGSKTLTIASTRQGREGGEVKTTMVYDKQ